MIQVYTVVPLYSGHSGHLILWLVPMVMVSRIKRSHCLFEPTYLYHLISSKCPYNTCALYDVISFQDLHWFNSLCISNIKDAMVSVYYMNPIHVTLRGWYNLYVCMCGWTSITVFAGLFGIIWAYMCAGIQADYTVIIMCSNIWVYMHVCWQTIQ